MVITSIALLEIANKLTAPTEEQVTQKLSDFKFQSDPKKAMGYDVIEAEEFLKKANQAFGKKNYRKANKLLDNAFDALEKAEIHVIPKTSEEEVKELSQIEVASLYERVTDGTSGRTIGDVIDILNETKTDFIFRGFWRWTPVPESPETVLPSEYPSDYVEKSAKEGYTYQQLNEAINEIKKEDPDVIFCGAIPAQSITILVWNPQSGEYFGPEETWDMALDPEKWGINFSKKKFQCEIAKSRYYIDPSQSCENYDRGKVFFYVPDITNENFQKLLLSWAKIQIDSGTDAIWIDMLFSQAGILKEITNDPNHPAVKESFESASKIVDEIHNYGYSKGKHIYVGTWPTSAMYPYPQPKLDFVTLSPSSEEVYFMQLDEVKIDNKVKKIRKKLGNVSIFVFIDWGGDSNSPLGVFSQKLSKNDQEEFLKISDNFYRNKGLIFIYPIHGGGMGIDAKTLSFGNCRVYDAIAQEFDTYETIREVANK